MRILNLLGAAWTSALLALPACSPSDPVDLEPLPDLGPLRDAAVIGGAGGEGGFGGDVGGAGGDVGGAGGDVGGAGGAGGEGGAAGGGGTGGGGGSIYIDDSLNFNPLRLAVLADEDEGWLVWYDEEAGELLSRTVPALSGGEQPELGEVQVAVADLSADDLTQRLQGVHQAGRPWWIFLADGALSDPEDASSPRLIQALNLESGARIPLGIVGDTYYGGEQPRIRVAYDPINNNVLVVGRRADDDDNYLATNDVPPVGWQILHEDGQVEDPVHDNAGIAFPEDAVYALGSFVFSLADGHCAVLDGALNAPQIQSGWRCGYRSGARLLVDDDVHLTFAGPLEGVADGPRLWRAAPGQEALPEDDVANTDGLVQIPEDDLSVDNWSPVQRLNPDAWVIFYRTPAEGEAVGDPRFLLLEGEQVRRLDVSALEAPLSLLRRDEGASLQVVIYTDGAMSLVPSDVVEAPSLLAETPRNTLDGTPLPEDCSDADQDRDGASRNGLCCLSGAPAVSPVLEGRLTTTPSDGAGVTALLPGASPATALLALPTTSTEGGDELTLLLSYANGDDGFTTLGQWIDSSRPSKMIIDDSGERVLVDAYGDSGRIILWGQRSGDAWTLEPRAYPCPEPDFFATSPLLDMEFISGSAARFYCATDMREIDFDVYATPPGEALREDLFTITAYPDGAQFYWMTRRRIQRPETELVPTWVALTAADGDDADNPYPLQAWSLEGGGFEALPLDDVDLLDATISELDRLEPIVLSVQPNGPTIRRRGASGEWLEIFYEGLGWLRLPGARKPSTSLIVPDAPLAYTLGYLDDFEGRFGNNEAIGLFSHDLSAGADWWGRLMPQDLADPEIGSAIQQAGFLPFTEGSDGPWVYRMVFVLGEETPMNRFDAYTTSCD